MIGMSAQYAKLTTFFEEHIRKIGEKLYGNKKLL